MKTKNHLEETIAAVVAEIRALQDTLRVLNGLKAKRGKIVPHGTAKVKGPGGRELQTTT